MDNKKNEKYPVTKLIEKAIDFIIQKLDSSANQVHVHEPDTTESEVPTTTTITTKSSSWWKLKYKLNLLHFIRSYEIRANQIELLQKISLTTGIPPFSVALAWGLVFVILVKRWFHDAPKIFYQSFGLLVPVYQTLKAIEQPKQNDDERYLSFWSTFGLWSFVESSFEPFKKTPAWYNYLRLATTYWLLERDHAIKLYREFYRPMLTVMGVLMVKDNMEDSEKKQDQSTPLNGYFQSFVQHEALTLNDSSNILSIKNQSSVFIEPLLVDEQISLMADSKHSASESTTI